jgi:glutamyl-tRNA reductase
VSAELFCIGLSHKTAPVGVRERLALSDGQASDLLRTLAPAALELMVVSTCNRVEVYALAASLEGSARTIREELGRVAGARVDDHLYEHRGESALVHLFRVAASLDSMVVGEPQILGQVKDAFELAQRAGTVRADLVRIMTAAFGAAKRVRTETGVGRTPVSMASAAVELARKVFGSLEGKAVLLVGAGEMSEVAGRHLLATGVRSMVITNRTFERAEQLAATLGARASPFESVGQELIHADVVVCSTASPTPLFNAANVEPVLKPRRHRPLFMVDLAVPRDVAPDVQALDGVYTYDVDDIQKVVAESAAARSAEAAKAEALIAEDVARFVRDRAVRDGMPVLAQLRARAEEIARGEVERSLSSWAAELTQKQQRSLEAMALAVVNKLLHQPTAKLRSVGADETENRLAGAAAELFGLEAGGQKTGSKGG